MLPSLQVNSPHPTGPQREDMPVRVVSSTTMDQFPQPCSTRTSELPPRYCALLDRLGDLGFLREPNKRFVPDVHKAYRKMVNKWLADSHSIVVDNRTGVEYFAQFRNDSWMMVSIGVQSASDIGGVKLHEYLCEGLDINSESFHNRIGQNDHGAPLRDFLISAVGILGCPNTALIHDVYLDSVQEFEYVEIELCRALWGTIPEPGDISFISRTGAGITVFSQCNKDVPTAAMCTSYTSECEDDMKRQFEHSEVPLDVYLKYEIANAVRVVPHNSAVNRRRYAALLSQRKPPLEVPNDVNARFVSVCTSRIKTVDAAGRPIRHQWTIPLVLARISVCCASVIVFGLSYDLNVNAAELVATGLASLTLLLVSIPQLYVGFIGGYHIGELYRGITPVSWILHKYGFSFLRECLSKGVNVEPFISGHNASYLLNKAAGNIRMPRPRLRDLDDRWNYGVNKDGQLCIRYRNAIGVMRVHSAAARDPAGESSSGNGPDLTGRQSDKRRRKWSNPGSRIQFSSSGTQTKQSSLSSLSKGSTIGGPQMARHDGEGERGWRLWHRKASTETSKQTNTENRQSGNQRAMPSEWRWWSCTHLDSNRVNAVAESEVDRLLGDGEVGRRKYPATHPCPESAPLVKSRLRFRLHHLPTEQ